MENQIETIKLMVMGYLPKIALAIILLFVGFKILNVVSRFITKALDRNKVDPSLSGFLASICRVSLKIALFISVAGLLGINTTSFITILGAAGLAVGMALKGTLSNFAGGAMIIIFRPFKVGDFIEAQGFSGTVREIKIFSTILNTPDNKTVIIPNGPLSTGNIVNFSTEPIRRVDMVFGIGYDDDLKLAKKTLTDLVEKESRVLKDPAFAVLVSELADSSVNFTIRMFVKSADYWGVYFDMMENVKLTFDELGISIPFPQRDVHLHEVKA